MAPRRHGLQLPLSKEQLGAWLVLGGCVAGCYAFQIVIVSDKAAFIALVTVYTVCVALVLALGAVAR